MPSGRVVDAFLALPLVIVALLALVALGTSNTTVVVVIGVVFAPIIARTVRAAVLSERELDYVAAAELRGESALHIMFVEILPNVMPPILVESTVRLGYAIFAVATLSFIGFGIQPPSADWGLAIAEAIPISPAATGGRCCSMPSPSPPSSSASICWPTASRGRWRHEPAHRARPAPPPMRSPSPISTSAIGCAGATAGCSGGSASASGGARPMGWSGNRAAANRPPRCAAVRYLPRNGKVAAGSIARRRPQPPLTARRRAAPSRANTVSMVYQDPGRALNPSIRVGSRWPRSSA